MNTETLMSIWFACKPEPRSIRSLALATTSHKAMHYGIGGAIDPMVHDVLMNRVGVSLFGHRKPA